MFWGMKDKETGEPRGLIRKMRPGICRVEEGYFDYKEYRWFGLKRDFMLGRTIVSYTDRAQYEKDSC